jgi:hypothetical protein
VRVECVISTRHRSRFVACRAEAGVQLRPTFVLKRRGNVVGLQFPSGLCLRNFMNGDSETAGIEKWSSGRDTTVMLDVERTWAAMFTCLFFAL